jgi:hypothetical protein
VKPDPIPQYTIENNGPFCRALVRVYGRTEVAALEAGRELQMGLSRALSEESTCYTPGYRGFDSGVLRHYAVIAVALGGDRAAEEARLKGFLDQLSSSSR